MKTFIGTATLGIALATTACTAGPAPRNLTSANWAPGQLAAGTGHPQGEWVEPAPVRQGDPGCIWQQPGELAQLRLADFSEWGHVASPLAAGDRLRVELLGDSDRLSGNYVIGSDGRLTIPGVKPLMAAGRTESELQAALRSSLVSANIVRPLRNAVDISLIESAGVSAAVSGAVFAPGAVRAGERNPDSRIGLKEGAVRGDHNVSRTVASAIRAAGGVRPDADVSHIYLIRGDAYMKVDLSGMIHGWTARDVSLTTGDRIIVPSRKCFDPSLVRPTPLTIPGIRVYMSNLTRSANNNAGAAIGKETTSLPYGTRLLQALVAMNCVGGTYMASDRRAVLISRNPINGQSIVVERDVEKLVRLADRDRVNPYLMPDDAIACYDSRWTNFRDALGMVSEAVSTATPAILIGQAVN
ncbi:polysaccharide biosynthesis protein [Altericroceibacterium spongiae]|uniref:Polysaccharide biosynthesis protein n=1 Tax=Altericroceibacterium spongiae TaxID=2320269 RepID=A0A420ECD6_9SPHN|nr:polysaccharide biosynthesis/export family protein [Altericroceibacterium spongiae]RKF18302.1 polysaccharide biosynthesis protein [Altericroceibacterium spongiae]